MLFGSLILGVTDRNLYFRKVKTMQSSGKPSSRKRMFYHNKNIVNN